MTVGELFRRLEDLPYETKVYVRDDEGTWHETNKLEIHYNDIDKEVSVVFDYEE